MIRRTGGLFCFVGLAVGIAHADPATDEAFFESKIRPILVNTCVRCHGEQKSSGGLRLDSKQFFEKGGESGALIDGDAEKSLLLQAVRRSEDVSAMPPDKSLTPLEIELVAKWVASGAHWPTKIERIEAARHWSFEPIQSTVPPSTNDGLWPQSAIDSFILEKMESAKRSPSEPADRRTLIRRATYDLTGLPPATEDVELFWADDSPDAFERLIDRLLSSPAYGEQWGRKWLDVVRYADTAGENTDRPLPHAWRYRNWVIDAFNKDMPYDAFVKDQIAGDLIAKDGSSEEYSDHVVATGFLAISRRFGHNIDKDIHLTYEDTLDTTGKAFLGLSLGCCRCHDHKYDPLTTRDYYGLYGVLESTKLSFPGCEPESSPRDLIPMMAPSQITALMQPFDEEFQKLDQDVKSWEAKEASLTKDMDKGSIQATLLVSGSIEDAESAPFLAEGMEPIRLAVKKGEIIQLVVAPRGNHGADTTLVEFEITETGGEHRRWNVKDLVDDSLAANPHSDKLGHDSVWCFLDERAGLAFLSEHLTEVNGKQELKVWRNGDTPSVLVNTSATAVDVWTSLPAKSFFVHPGPDGPVAVAWISPVEGEITFSGRIADAHPSGPDGVDWRIEHIPSLAIAERLTELRKAGAAREESRRKRDAVNAARPVVPVAYAVTDAKPVNTRLQKRGEPTDLGDEVPRKFLDVLGGKNLESPTTSGRREMADCLVNRNNPLAARVMVNRIWQGHFGQGIVTSPNDFGTRGQPPTHPELLDYLANEFIESGWSIKEMHRSMMGTATYQQRSGESEVDHLYASFSRRRLTAEEIRDTQLVASGNIDRTKGEGHPFPPESSWRFSQHAPFADEYPTRQRSVYVMQKRSRRNPYFALFDGADPNASTPVRDVTTVPTQALYFMNDPFFHEQATGFADRIMHASINDVDRIEFACQTLFGRPATSDEIDRARSFVRDYESGLDAETPEIRTAKAWQAWGRVMLASNEALYVD